MATNSHVPRNLRIADRAETLLRMGKGKVAMIHVTQVQTFVPLVIVRDAFVQKQRELQ